MISAYSLIQKELKKNKEKALEHQEIMIEMHKRFINSEHPEFDINSKLREKNIRCAFFLVSTQFLDLQKMY